MMSSSSEPDQWLHQLGATSGDKKLGADPLHQSVGNLSLKRRRVSDSSSIDSFLNTKRHQHGQYNDRYRILFNEDINDIATLLHSDIVPNLPTVQIGSSSWSALEKHLFFEALARLGKDQISGISRAIGTKTVPEVRDFSLLLLNASLERKDSRLTLRDIPAATEISTECSGVLEAASDTLAWYQERFEAKQEQERFGRHWLITPEVAEELSAAQGSSRPPSVSSSPPPTVSEFRDSAPENNAKSPQILRDIPEGNLLDASNMLRLSSMIYMNGSSSPPSWYPHWSTYISPVASAPSIYRTAFNDLHALAVSLTRRLTQASIIQASSRLRSQGWRGVKKAAIPLVRKRDVLSAIDVLRLPRDSKEAWRLAARRCRLRVFDGTGTDKKELSWEQVEDALGSYKMSTDIEPNEELIPGLVSSGDEEDFKSRAMRSGTPLPMQGPSPTDSERENTSVGHFEGDDSEHDALGSSGSARSSSQSVRSNQTPEIHEGMTLEEFDLEASRQDELHLWHALAVSPPFEKQESVRLEDEVEEHTTHELGDVDNWRDWIEYHADWADLDVPIPAASFIANQKKDSSAPLNIQPRFDAGVTSTDNLEATRQQRRSNNSGMEIPIRGARAYAAMQDMVSVPGGDEGEQMDLENSSQFVARSIEDEHDVVDALGSTFCLSESLG